MIGEPEDQPVTASELDAMLCWMSQKPMRPGGSYALKHNVPYNPLHDKNYPSIGCTHCTRAVRPGESARAGRWSGSDKVECGLHVAAPAAIAPLVEIKVGCEES
jgi:hypothetical protein